MVSIKPRVDLLRNTVVDWICKLSYFRLDTLDQVIHDNRNYVPQILGASGVSRVYKLVGPQRAHTYRVYFRTRGVWRA